MSGGALSESLSTLVESLDLSEYEITVYLAVIEHGELTASEISEETSVPQPRVYDTARALADRGLVELKESRPMRVMAIHPAEAFGDLSTAMDELVDDLSSLYTAPSRELEAATLVRSRSSIIRYLQDVITSAAFELTLALPPGLLERFGPSLREAIDRDVSVTLVVAPAAEAPDPDEFDYRQVATRARGRRGITTPVVAVADGEYSVYATQEAVRNDDDKYGVIFNRSALGFLVQAFFGTLLWTTADRELRTDEITPSFPRQYASIRRCGIELAEFDGPIYARIAGRDVLTGERRVISGEVLDSTVTDDQGVATLVIDVDGEEISVGGRMAAYEDIEAREIELDVEPFLE